ncbi:hypothetical protein [Streptomyces sp. HUAS TT7]|uniref:hypothetical protein n=1 Tax=Streptomyces sp. HUAS TT7 TaxID=3447507 RepID=UPI003F65B5C9
MRVTRTRFPRLWLRTSDASALREQLVQSNTPDVGPLQDSPFGPTFSVTGPEGYRLTVHGGCP